jgi:hypothetical protein
MAVIGFNQDPEGPEGAGMFALDDGRQLYAHDPELAAQVSGPPPMQLDPMAFGVDPNAPDQRLASNGFQTTEQRLAAGGAVPGLDSQLNTMADVAPTPSPPPQAPPQPPQPQGPPPPPQPGEPGGPTERDVNVANYLQDRFRMQSQRRPEAWIPRTRAETVETEGVPYNEEDAAARIRANQQVMEAKGATAQLLRDRAINEMAAAKAAQPELMQRAAEAQKQVDAQQSAYMADREALQQAIDNSNSVKGSQSEWFASKGTLAQIIMILGQAFGAYAQIRAKQGPNYFAQTIQGMMESDIAAQKDQAKRGMDNALKRLEFRYKDRDQAEAALRIAQGNILSNVQSMHASANQAEDVQAMHQELLATNQQNLIAQEQKFQNAAYGKHTLKQDLAHQAASGGGRPDPLVLVKKLIDAGMDKEEAWTYVFGKGGDGVPSKEVQEQAKELANKTADIAKAQAALGPARELVQKYAKSDSIPGLGLGADLAAAVPYGVGQRAFSDEEARVNRGVIERVALAYQNAVTGAGGGEKEQNRIRRAFLGSGTPKELTAAIDDADRQLADLRRHHESGYDPRAIRLLYQRGAYQPKVAPGTLTREAPPPPRQGGE